MVLELLRSKMDKTYTHQPFHRSRALFYLPADISCDGLRTGQNKLALIDSWSRVQANGGYLASHFVAWSLYLHAITNPTLHKVLIHARRPSLRCTVNFHTPLPSFKPQLQNHQTQRQLAFLTCPLVFHGNRLWQFPDVNHRRQLIKIDF